MKKALKKYCKTYNFVLTFCLLVYQVYQRSDLNRLMMSQSIGPFCNLNQDITSYNASEGAAVALELLEYERESKY